MRTQLASLREVVSCVLSICRVKKHRQILTSNPGDEIAILSRRQLVSPMILPTCRWETTGKLCKRSDDCGITSPAEEKAINKTCRATVL
jgi:hypothetical protein